MSFDSTSNIFVDRINEFDLIYKGIDEVIQGKKDKYVFFVTGIGGIGKSALLRELTIVNKYKLFEKSVLPFYMNLDDEMPTSSDLLRLSKALLKVGGETNLFMLFFTLYKRMLEGIEPAKIEGTPDFIKEFTEEIAMEILGAIPGIGLISLVAKRIYGFFKKRMSNEEKWLRAELGDNYGEKLSEIIIDTPMELLRGMAKALARDINKAIDEGKIKAVLIAIDTTEKINKRDQNIVLELLRNIDRVIMIITGREAPDDIRNSKYLLKLEANKAVKFHKLLALSESDAKDYLRKRGITEKDISEIIIHETGAIPQLLGVAADLLEAFAPEELKRDLFKTNLKHWKEILLNYIEKLLKHVDASLEEAIYITAIPRIFDKEIIRAALNRMITPTLYNKLTKLSFYKPIEGDQYTMHREVREVLLSIMSMRDKKEVIKKLEKYFMEKYEETDDPRYIAEIIYITGIINEDEALNLLWESFDESLSKARYETCQLLLDAFNPTKDAYKIRKKTLQAKLLMRIAKLEEAIDTILEIDFDDLGDDILTWHYVAMALQDLGEAYTRLGDMKNAVKTLNKSVTIYDEILKSTEYKDKSAFNNKGLALQTLGEILMRLGELEESIKKLEEAIEAYDEALRLSDNKNVEAWNNKGTSLRELGVNKFRLGRVQEAIKDLNESILSYQEVLKLKDGEDVDAWNNKGLVLQTMGEIYSEVKDMDKAIEMLKEAIDAYDEALRLSDNKSTIALNNKGSALQDLGYVYMKIRDKENALKMNKEAVDTYNRALELTENRFIEALNNKGIALQVIGEIYMNDGLYEESIRSLKESIRSFDMALELTNNQHIESWNNRGIALEILGELYYNRDDINNSVYYLKEAIKSFDESLKLTSNRNLDAWNNKGIALDMLSQVQIRMSNYDEAIETMLKAIEAYDEALRLTDRKYARAWYNKGSALQVLGELFLKLADKRKAMNSLKEAVKSFEMTLDLTNKKHIDAWNNRGIVLYLIGKLLLQNKEKKYAREAFCESLKSFKNILELGGKNWEELASKNIEVVETMLQNNEFTCS